MFTRVLTVVAGALLAGVAACSSPTSPDGPFRTEVTLQPGQVTAVASTPLRVGFERVSLRFTLSGRCAVHPVG